MEEQIDQLKMLEARLIVLETSDRSQISRINLIRRWQLGCFGAIGLGFLLSLGVIQSPTNRELLERVSVGFFMAAAAGLIGGEFVDKKPTT
jgi:hypothetical protein